MAYFISDKVHHVCTVCTLILLFYSAIISGEMKTTTKKKGILLEYLKLTQWKFWLETEKHHFSTLIEVNYYWLILTVDDPNNRLVCIISTC